MCIRHGVALQAVGAVTLQATMEAEGKGSVVYRRWDDGFLVRRMRREEVRQVTKWFESTGNSAQSVDLEVAFEIRGDNDGFCVGELKGKMIASAVIIQIAEDLHYGSKLLIVEQYRNLGLVDRLTAVVHDIVDRCNWKGIVGLEAASHAQTMFQKFGYKSACNNMIIYQGTAPANVDREFGTDIRLVKKAVNLGLLSLG